MEELSPARMKHIFIVNPAAGRQSGEARVRDAIRAHAGGLITRVVVTAGPGDATRQVRALCLGEAGPLRFYACGGDGTLNEVVNGAAGFPDASVACWPSGSGNDYVKYYGGRGPFLDLAAQLAGRETPVDLMRVGDRLAVNMVHFGFDSRVAEAMVSLRRLPVLGGRNAYYTAIARTFLGPLSAPCAVWVDGELLEDGPVLLCTVACGQYVGGSFRCAPRSDNADGLLDVGLVRRLGRVRFVRMIASYAGGRHLNDPRLSGSLLWRRGRRVRVTMPEGPLSLDGEVIRARDFDIQVEKHALRFVVPSGAAPIGPGPSG